MNLGSTTLTWTSGAAKILVTRTAPWLEEGGRTPFFAAQASICRTFTRPLFFRNFLSHVDVRRQHGDSALLSCRPRLPQAAPVHVSRRQRAHLRQVRVCVGVIPARGRGPDSGRAAHAVCHGGFSLPLAETRHAPQKCGWTATRSISTPRGPLHERRTFCETQGAHLVEGAVRSRCAVAFTASGSSRARCEEHTAHRSYSFLAPTAIRATWRTGSSCAPSSAAKAFSGTWRTSTPNSRKWPVVSRERATRCSRDGRPSLTFASVPFLSIPGKSEPAPGAIKQGGQCVTAAGSRVGDLIVLRGCMAPKASPQVGASLCGWKEHCFLIFSTLPPLPPRPFILRLFMQCLSFSVFPSSPSQLPSTRTLLPNRAAALEAADGQADRVYWEQRSAAVRRRGQGDPATRGTGTVLPCSHLGRDHPREMAAPPDGALRRCRRLARAPAAGVLQRRERAPDI